MENPFKMDDLGGFPPIFGNTHICTNLIVDIFPHEEMFFFPMHEMVGKTVACISKASLGAKASRMLK